MRIHSSYLVHWTGRDIEPEPESAERQKLYLKRLIDYYTNGLFARRTEEDVVRGLKIKDVVRLCFTEIKLSQVKEHSDRYGRLGIGFDRNYLMDKGCRPVIYIPFDSKVGSRLLEDSISRVYQGSEANTEVHKAAEWIMAHVKRMSKGSEDYYEEMEWRLVHDETSSSHFTKSAVAGVYRLVFTPMDARLVIFPDEATKRLSLQSGEMELYFRQHLPVLATLQDCSNF